VCPNAQISTEDCKAKAKAPEGNEINKKKAEGESHSTGQWVLE
jgi:hypothetical protein